ncbi:hypothetical protein GIY11_06705 [Aerococcaceae bacterium DSM 109653]|uniref:DUF3796 domain-containing protein n=1 Tax=Fundicoccus ignavus TaxID=2664442 RepID=A0A844BUV9_9LACT|nr:hypothetical protein [Fundicoccus ignavus]MRI81703.1 hypothetical protein [Fundicoccus ignavus]
MTAKSISAICQVTAHITIFAWQYYQQLHLTSSRLPFETQIYFWGTFFIRTILMTVAVQIAISIVFHIIFRIKTGERIDLQDERDQLFELRSLRNFSIIFAIGFYLGMLLLMFNFSIATMFQSLAFAYLFAGMTLSASQIFYYERGY